MLIKKEDRVQKQISQDSFVWEYPFNNEKLGVCISKITGRFPDRGRAINNKCDEMYYVVSGTGKAIIEDKEFQLGYEDVLQIKAGNKYFIEGQELVIVVATSPEWQPEQAEMV